MRLHDACAQARVRAWHLPAGKHDTRVPTSQRARASAWLIEIPVAKLDL
jgi:hypothetical protein